MQTLSDEQILALALEVAKTTRYLKNRNPQATVDMIVSRYGMCGHAVIHPADIGLTHGLTSVAIITRIRRTFDAIARIFSQNKIKFEVQGAFPRPVVRATCETLPSLLTESSASIELDSVDEPKCVFQSERGRFKTRIVLRDGSVFVEKSANSDLMNVDIWERVDPLEQAEVAVAVFREYVLHAQGTAASS